MGDPFAYVRRWREQWERTGFWHSFELPDGRVVRGLNDLAGLKNRIAQFPIPADLRGKRVLDVGAWDGWFSFEMERRGAEVLAIDVEENTRFEEMREALGSRVERRLLDVYELTPECVGRFEIVLFLGVLYHLKHPLLGLERICAVTKEFAAVDSFVLREAHRPGAGVDGRPVMEFYETDEMGGQTDNWVGPSLPCLLALCRSAGFARVRLLSELPESACVGCWRQWEPVPEDATPAPALKDALHATNFGVNFASRRDEYLTAWFEWPGRELALDDVKPEVGPYGVRPIHVSRLDDGSWHANFRLPPGIDAGWHDVRMRVRDSARSNPRRVAVDVPLRAEHLEITGLCDGASWTPNLLSGGVLCLWVGGLPENADRHNVRVTVAGRRARTDYVEAPKGGLPRQVNVTAPAARPPGRATVVVECGEAASRAEPVEIHL
jgi:tRNA (mo5U34)-methyltransferase